MSKINDFVDGIGEDKGLHLFFAGNIAYVIKDFVAILFRLEGWWLLLAAAVGLAVAVGLDLFKEYALDDEPDKGDILYSFAGGCLPVVATALFLLLEMLR